MAGFSASPDVIQDLTIQGGCITLTNAATDIDLIDNNASALSFDACGKTGLLEIITTDCSEGVQMSADLTVAGDFTVNGTTTTVSSTVTTIADPLVIYSQGTTGTPTKDSGFIVERGCSNNVGIIWDESEDHFAIIGNTSETGSTAGNVSISGYADVKACGLTLGTALTVGNGGTGASTLTCGGVLLGSGTGAITALAVLSDGEMLVGDGTGDPVAESGATLRTSIGLGTGQSPQFTGLTLTGDLSVAGGCVSFSQAATDVDLINNTAAALSFDSGVLAGIINIDTTTCSEGVSMSGYLTVGSAGSGADVTFHSATSGDNFLWDSSCEKLVITGTNGQTALDIADGNVVIADNLSVFGGCVIFTATATNINLNDDCANALSFDVAGKADIIKIITTDCSEGVSMSGSLEVDGTLNLDGTVDADVTDFDLASSGDVDIVSSNNTACAIYIAASTGTTATLRLRNTQGTNNAAINIGACAGGIHMSAAGQIQLNPTTFVKVGANSTNAAEMRMFEDTDNGCNYVALKAPNVSTSYTITLPTAVAAASCYVLTSTCAGVTSWAAAAGGGVPNPFFFA